MSIFGVVLVTYDLLTLELLCVCVLLFLVFFYFYCLHLLRINVFISPVARNRQPSCQILVLLRLFLVELWANVTHQTDDVTLTLTFDL